MATIFSSNPIENRAGHIRNDNFVDRLANPIPNNSTGPIFALLQIGLSLGLLPLLLWPVRWTEFLDEERQALHDHVQWWSRRADNKEAKKLDKIASRLKRRPLLMIIPWLAVGLNVLVIAIMLSNGATPQQIWEVTFDHVNHTASGLADEPWQSNNAGFIQLGNRNTSLVRSYTYSGPNSDFYKIWVISLLVGYAVHWYAVRSHANAVQSLVDWTNKLARENNFSRIKPNVGCVGLNFLWILLAIGLCGMHAWWAIPMIFAGAMQRQYSRKTSLNVRAALAGQTREAFAITRSGPDRTCSSATCGATLPAAANYCPRCGSHV